MKIIQVTKKENQMSKMKKLYKLNMNDINKMNIGHLNPTMKAIVKSMYRLEKSNLNDSGMCGDDILRYAIKEKLWSTSQSDDKLHTTWSFYVKRLKEECQVIEVGSISDAVEEYLE